MKFILSLTLSISLCTILSAQKSPIKWGKVDKADLNMTVYENDPDAEAVVLMDYGALKFDLSTGDFKYILDRHIRIKILKRPGFDQGDISIPYYSYNDSEKIRGLKAQVILPNGDEKKVKKQDIFEEDTNKYWSKIKFAFPALEEGCIIEYKYTVESDQIYYLTDWYFQKDIPTRHSELCTTIPEWFEYISFRQGLNPVEETGESTQLMRTPRVEQAHSLSRAGEQINVRIETKRYYLENVPALKPEKYITTMKDYYAKLSLQLQTVRFPNSVPQDMSTTWSSLAKDLKNNESFGLQINKKRFSNQIVSAIEPHLEGLDNDADKVSKIYTFLSQNVTWNELYGFFSNSLDKAFEKKSASSGELNLMLIAVCRQLGIEAYPVLVSTRSHGRMLRHYPKTDQFNHVLAFVQIGDQQMLLDVGSPNRSPDLIRMEALNYIGWLVDPENPQWIDIPSNLDTETTMATMALDEEGSLSGTIKQSFKGYCAMRERSAFHEYKKDNHKDVKEEWSTVFPDSKVAAVQFENEENTTKNLIRNLDIEIPNAAQVNDPFIYISPMLGMGLDENPLKLEKRTFPVDIPVQHKTQFILNLTIPQGFIVEELPESISLKTEGNGANFQYRLSQTGDKIQVISKMTLEKLHYEPEEYSIIRNFFGVVVEKQEEQIVLKRATP